MERRLYTRRDCLEFLVAAFGGIITATPLLKLILGLEEETSIVQIKASEALRKVPQIPPVSQPEALAEKILAVLPSEKEAVFPQETTELPQQIEIEAKTSNEALPIAWMPEPVLRWSPEIKEVADKYQVDPNLIATVILSESGGNFCAVSPSAALGLMQVLEYNAPGENLFIPKTNILAGVHYLATQYDEFGNWDKAVLAYNGGPGNVRRGTIPSEAKRYLRWIKGMWNEVNQAGSSTFQEWSEKGGKILVEKATQLYENETRLKVVEFATIEWHKPYLYGGEGPNSWDCSALVQAAYRDAGIEIPRTATEQWQEAGRILERGEECLPGDLVFFTLNKATSDHVGMIIFQPDVFIEASGIAGLVRASSLSSNSGIYREDLAKRVLGFKRLI